MISGALQRDERELEGTLRPQSFEEYIGQQRVKEQVAIAVASAKRRGEALDHVLLFGPPGLGKTSLAYIIARELGVNIRTTSGPAIERPAELSSILTNLAPRDVLFIDEIHRLPRKVEETLYPAMEDHVLDIVIGKGPAGRSVRIPLSPFTLIGATTRVGQLAAPFRDRFGVIARLDYYSPGELEQVILRAANLMAIPVEREAVEELARRARGTPRVANRLLRRLRDYATVRAEGVITRAVAVEGLRLLEVDEQGLDRLDRAYLRFVAEHYGGGPVGVDTIAAGLSEDAETLEDVVEPFLMQIGYVERTPRGRLITERAFRHIGLAPPKRPTLFPLAEE